MKGLPSPVAREGSPAEHARRDELARTWAEYMYPVLDDGDGDYEDFWEDAARLEAAVDAFGAENLWIQRDTRTAMHASTRTELPVSDLRHLRRFGIQATQDDYHPMNRVERYADSYANLRTFRENVGRTFVLAGFNAPTGTRLEDAIRGVAAGHPNGRAIVKVNRVKEGLYDIQVPKDATDLDIIDILSEKAEWTLIRMEEAVDGFLVQAHVPMRAEYRMFIVDGEPVTGAGCIEEFTPVQNQKQFDTRIRWDRSQKDSPVTDRPDHAGYLLEFGRRFAAQLQDEKPELTQYVLDAAISTDGKPIAIELNSLLNSGMYASDHRYVARAFANRTHASCS